MPIEPLPETEPAPAPAKPAIGIFVLGTLLLVVAAAAAGVLSYTQITGNEIPGCGLKSACAQATGSKWGKVPVVNVPVSFLGLAYFAALLAAWTRFRGRLGGRIRVLAVLGGLVSIGYLGIMLTHRLACPYCITSHVANLLFIGLLARSAWRPLPAPAAGAGLMTAAFVGIISMVALLVEEDRTRQAIRQREAAQLAESVQRLKEQSTKPAPPQPMQTGAAQPPAPATAQPAATPPVAPATQAGFTGRYRWGPAAAALRVVMFTGYQCPDCRAMEQQVMAIIKERPDVSLSIKQFPLSSDCNSYMGGQNPHPNGCWAARAAEAAGILGGNEGFQRMSAWLFERGGAFTAEAIRAALPTLGFADVEGFLNVMRSERTTKLVQEDIEEGVRLGLLNTPMIFINGVEVLGWRSAPDALTKTIREVAATNPPVAGPENDRPPIAAEKFIALWRQGRNMAWPSRQQTWSAVPAGSPVNIQIWGDFLEPGTADLDKRIRGLIAGRDDVRYEFRYFPVDQSCNPNVPQTFIANSCRAVMAAEAAGKLGGATAYWAMHEWLMANQKTFSDDSLRAAAPGMGLNPELLLATMNTPEIKEIITTEVGVARRIGMPSIPRLFINGRIVERWDAPGGNILERILDEAPTVPQ